MKESKRSEYLKTLSLIIITERERGEEWRFSQTAIPKHRTYPWILAKAGHIQKLENEGIVERTYSSRRKTRYRLSVSREDLVEEMKEYKDLISEDLKEELF
ncbi:hypothetical protein AKJ65_06410 [candidate division MSBL1 archaeon SCGC-AAA259E19]|uniref:PadR family transcriptional regulator n=1 Tax=candidate division MSBL1 archaeon SCGC-AAA259E19 TaxID=1698264 RepID=A0A133UGK1_9EURY|nr:hypothetical protein AKJ65_06410 [candidate division MSBL1 archaeon SCGC-AAA259E19]